MRKISFKDFYKEFIEGIATPREQFLHRICEVTDSSPATISMWLSGYYTPKKEAVEKIASHFDLDPESLFPNQRTKRIKKQSDKDSDICHS